MKQRHNNGRLGKLIPAVLTILGSMILTPMSLAQNVMSDIVGTWKLEGSPWVLFLAIRTDGTYRIHGQSTQHRYRGTMMANDGQWTLQGPGWTDHGTYSLSSPDVATFSGLMGVSHWRRAWHPEQPPTAAPGDVGVCNMLRVDEVAEILGAPVAPARSTGARQSFESREALEGCRYSSTLNNKDRIDLLARGGSHDYRVARDSASQLMTINDVGNAAFADISTSGVLTARVLRGDKMFRIELYLDGGAAPADLPLITDLARLANSRWQPR